MSHHNSIWGRKYHLMTNDAIFNMIAYILVTILYLNVLKFSNSFHFSGIRSTKSTIKTLNQLKMIDSSMMTSLPLADLHDMFDAAMTTSMPLAELDSDTLGALGDAGRDLDLSSVVEGGQPNVAMSVLMKITGSPLILAVPISAGALVALVLGIGISSYSNGKEAA